MNVISIPSCYWYENPLEAIFNLALFLEENSEVRRHKWYYSEAKARRRKGLSREGCSVGSDSHRVDWKQRTEVSEENQKGLLPKFANNSPRSFQEFREYSQNSISIQTFQCNILLMNQRTCPLRSDMVIVLCSSYSMDLLEQGSSV